MPDEAHIYARCKIKIWANTYSSSFVSKLEIPINIVKTLVSLSHNTSLSEGAFFFLNLSFLAQLGLQILDSNRKFFNFKHL